MELGYHLLPLKGKRAVLLPVFDRGYFSRKIVGWEVHERSVAS